MKKNIFLLLSVVLLLNTGCDKKMTPAAPQQTKNPTGTNEKTLIPWHLSYFGYFPGATGLQLLKDSVAFYSSAEITIDTLIFKNPKVSFKKDGAIRILRIGDDIERKVYTLTPGGLDETKKGPNGEDIMIIKFSRNDLTYFFEYWPKTDENGNYTGNYVMSANATLKFDGASYPINVKTSNMESILMCDLKEETKINPNKRSAEGVRPK